MWKRQKETRDYNDKVKHKRAQKLARRDYWKAKRDFEQKLAKDFKANPKLFYTFVRER